MNLANTHPGVPISYAATFYDFLKKNGLAADDIYAYAGVNTKCFDDPNNKVSLTQYITLSQQGLVASNNPGLGLVFGSQIALTDHNYLGFALQTCSNGLQANELMCRYMSMRFPSLKMQLIEDENHYTLTIEDWLDEPSLHLYNLEMVMAAIYKGALSLHYMDRLQRLGNEQKERVFDNILEIQFEYPRPNHFSQYQRVFSKQTLSFDQGKCRLLLNKEALLKPFSFFNSGSLKLAESLCVEELKGVWGIEPISTKVYNLLLDSPLSFTGLEDMAKHLNLSIRALSRALNEEDTSYQKIVDTVKKQLAIQHLNTSQLSIAQIAYQLGFEQPTNFTRAFKKWTGQSPSAYRL